jgi:hypothetical protein
VLLPHTLSLWRSRVHLGRVGHCPIMNYHFPADKQRTNRGGRALMQGRANIERGRRLLHEKFDPRFLQNKTCCNTRVHPSTTCNPRPLAHELLAEKAARVFLAWHEPKGGLVRYFMQPTKERARRRHLQHCLVCSRIARSHLRYKSTEKCL